MGFPLSSEALTNYGKDLLKCYLLNDNENRSWCALPSDKLV